MKTTFEAGQTVYSEHGEQAEYVAATGDGHIVRPVVEAYSADGEDGPYDHLCDPTMWRNVFPEPPVAKYGADLKALHDQIAAAKAERSQIESEERQRARERSEKLKKFAALDTLELFIDGQITHYVEQQFYGPPSIVSIEQCKADSSSYRENLRLLTLGGCLTSRSVTWSLNQYADGSGRSGTVTPCTSLEQAEELLKKAVLDHFASQQVEARADWISAAAKFGIEVPKAYRHKVAQQRIKGIEQNLNYTRSQAVNSAEALRKAEEELAQLRAYVSPAPQGEQ